ncbi:glycosyltransferase [Paenibacillus sp. NEAU-GSW1]|uniref:CgeB family protein n=1 Tax=Paenibacillus sp. NEAU-GSW1 TaxID=2682486 RepID=UPI0012E1C78F|nr:glycosyltransferase [Paenibacillus sp. NEAU-GSW1]MUT67082.1 glycosyltransferase [Paenibacillus sp. NEAU-GSW1]
MRIMFLESHPMWIHGLPNGFRRLGHQVCTIAPDKVSPSTLRSFKPDFIMTVGWTPANNRAWKQRRIAELAKLAGVPHVYWSTEDPGYTDTFSLPLIRRAKPDFVFTIHRKTIPRFRKLGISVAHLDFGNDPDTHKPMPVQAKYKSTAAMVANGYPQLYRIKPTHYRFQSIRKITNPFLELGLNVNLYGRYWNGMKRIFSKPIPSRRIHGYLPYKEAMKVYSSVDYVLGPQNAADRLTQRTYEILASGGLLITDDTPEVRRWFKPGKELLVTSSEEETKKLIHKYNKLPKARQRIRRNAIRASKAHSYEKRAAYVLTVLRKRNIISH